MPPTNNVIRFLGVLETAEKIPVEPEQGNACAGKVVNIQFSSLLVRDISRKVYT